MWFLFVLPVCSKVHVLSLENETESAEKNVSLKFVLNNIFANKHHLGTKINTEVRAKKSLK
jgi:hypothetical protein